MQFNSSIEKIEDIYQTYKECLIKIYDATTVITEALIGYAKKLKYEPVVNLAKDIVNYYNELKLDEIEVIDDWKRGQGNSKWMFAEEDVENIKSQMELQIKKQIQSWDEIRFEDIDVTNWKYSISDFESIKKEIDGFIELLETKKNQYESDMKNYKLKNELFVFIEPLIKCSISTAINKFKERTRKDYFILEQDNQEFIKFFDN